MKSILIPFFLFLLTCVALNAQQITCNSGTFEVTAVACDNNVMSFTVTNTNPTFCSSFIAIQNTTGIVVEGDAGLSVNQGIFFYDGTATVAIPNIGCLPLDLTLSYSGDACDNCTPQGFTLTAPAPIPSMGTWGIMILMLCLGIFGSIVWRKFGKTSFG